MAWPAVPGTSKPCAMGYIPAHRAMYSFGRWLFCKEAINSAAAAFRLRNDRFGCASSAALLRARCMQEQTTLM